MDRENRYAKIKPNGDYKGGEYSLSDNLSNKLFIKNSKKVCDCKKDECEKNLSKYKSITISYNNINNITFKDCVWKDIHINNIKECQGFISFDSLGSENIHFQPDLDKNTTFKNISIKLYNSYLNHFCFSFRQTNIKIDNFILDEILTKSEGDYLLENVIIEKEFKINNFINLSRRFVLKNLFVEHLSIKNSDLGRITFNSVEVKKLTLENSTLNDCIFNGIKFDSYELGEITNREGKYDFEKQKDNYRQLKHVMDKNGNHTEANKFYAKEMEYYRKNLSWKEPNFYLFLLQKTISNFGNSWIQALLCIFILGLFPFFWDAIKNINNLDFNFQNIWNAIDEGIKNIAIIPQLLSRAQIDSSKSIIYAIFMSYLIYSFIIALRRTTKR